MANLQCEHCLLEFPVSCFPDFDKGLVCEHCLAGEDAHAAQQKLIAKTKDMAGQVLDMQGVDDVLPKVRTVLAEVYSQFGGPRGFASQVVWMIQELSKRRPMPASAAQLMINLMKLHHTVEATDQEASLKDMSIDQIRREQELAMMQLAVEAAGDRNKREMLFALLSRQGYQVTEKDPAEHFGELVRTVNDENFAVSVPIKQGAGDVPRGPEPADAVTDAGGTPPGDGSSQGRILPSVSQRDVPGAGSGGDEDGEGGIP